ncbi:hypothetical protein CRE_03231 [Caenorhabditis remanei]|uniref:GRIP domain-containing protein n=1 Tax=Caenorhabditis remanei TaxID=31234 RepID=E3MMH1_CAERE|nr:hypothetical protein CRE_03231 [Caenorhabditis remanei]
MDSETDTDTHSLYGSETSRENYKSPESSDCEGYATPLASSLNDIAREVGGDVTINIPEDVDQKLMDSGEQTPVSTPRAISPPIVKQIMYLQKPRILVMTQREILDESSEEEFYDVDDVHIRDVAQQLLDGVVDVSGNQNERPDTPILAEDTTLGLEDISSDEDRSTPIQEKEEDVEELMNVDVEGLKEDMTKLILSDNESPYQNDEVETEIENSGEMIAFESDEDVKLYVETEFPKTESDQENMEHSSTCSSSETNNSIHSEDVIEQVAPLETAESFDSIDVQPLQKLFYKDSDSETSDVTSTDAPIVDVETCVNTFDNCDNMTANSVITECVHNNVKAEMAGKVEEMLAKINNRIQHDKILKNEDPKEKTAVLETEENPPEVSIFVNESIVVEAPFSDVADDESPEIMNVDASNYEKVDNLMISSQTESPVNQLQEADKHCEVSSAIAESTYAQNLVMDRPVILYEQMPECFSEITVAKTPMAQTEITVPSEEIEKYEKPHFSSNQETIENELMPTLVISDEVKTSPATDDDILSECSAHEVKVDFDGYSSGKEESLSSSTSSESFEFAEPVSSNNVHDEKTTQALRNSIIERYPSNETDEDELDSVDDEFDDDLLAVKQISAEVEQLVAAINAFGRDEEQQMSAYLVGKKMAAEKKRKSVMDTGVVTSSCHDQTVQTDSDSFILVDRHLPVVMESLQVEIGKLQADLEKVKHGEKELLKINSKLEKELEESQQTIDGIEVEAEQQYTELTSEIDELCEIVQKKDQELAALKERVANLSVSESNLRDDVDSQRLISQRQKEIIESLREELDAITKKLSDVTKLRDKAIEEATLYKMKNMERDRFLSREAQMSMEIEDLQRELNKQKLILNQTSMAKLADTFDRKVLHLENELRERDMLICKQNQIINSHRKSPTGSVITHRKMQPRASVLAAAGNLPSAGSSSESFQNGLDVEAKDALLTFILSDRHSQLANIYNIGRILDLSPQEERAVERHLTKDRFT